MRDNTNNKTVEKMTIDIGTKTYSDKRRKLELQRIRNARWRLKHKEELRTYYKNYRLQHPELKEYDKA